MTCDSLALLIGQNLQRLREDRGITQSQLATELRHYGVNWAVARVQDLENGRRTATLSVLISVSQALGSVSENPLALAELVEGLGEVDLEGDLSATSAELVDILRGAPVDLALSAVEVTGIKTELRQNIARFLEGTKDFPKEMTRATASKVGLPTLAEERLAKRVGISAHAVAAWAQHLWSQTLDDEASSRAGEGASPQAKGQATRKLEAELRLALDRQRAEG